MPTHVKLYAESNGTINLVDISTGSIRDDTRTWRDIIGVKVDLTVKQVTHKVMWATEPLEEHYAKGEAFVCRSGQDALISQKLEKPVPIESFIKQADMSSALKAELSHIQAGRSLNANAMHR